MKYENLLVTHSDCDGIASPVLVDTFNLPFDKIVSFDYGFEEEQNLIGIIRDSKNIVVADISLTQALHDELLEAGHSVRVFDHHDGTRWIAEKPGCVWDDKRSGAKIFFDEYVMPIVGRYRPSVREFIDLVDVYDRWDLESPLRPMSEDLQRVFVKYGNWGLDDNLARHDRFIAAMRKKLTSQDHFAWNPTELMYIKEAKVSEDKAYNEALAMLQIRRDNKGKRFGVYSAWGKISMVCHRMLNIDKMDVSYIVCVQTFHGKLGQVSFRSREGEFNLLELAGVDGHKASAGASLSPEEIKRFLQENMCFKYKGNLKINDDSSIIEECEEGAYARTIC
jgi:oligoribonuclease NrnB/cAMP/cGMP phosphodiesterase (DHH superfamily)